MKKFFPILFSLTLTFLLFFPQKIAAEPESVPSLKLYASSAALIDASNGRLLYGKSPYEEMPMASTTKIMTCIIALEYGKSDDVVTVSSYAASMPDVQLNVREGEQYYLGDLLYSLMLESHNDVAVAIAEHIGGSVEGFAELMNQKADALGLGHTQFVTPNGLDADGHYTTAYELGIIGAYAIRNEEFLAITNASSHTFSSLDGVRSFTVNNKDAFLTQMDGAIGIKTGFTSKAGYCFVGALKHDNKTFISVVLASGWPPNKSYKWADTRTLMQYGLNHYSYRSVFSPVDSFKTLMVTNGQADSVNTWVDGSLNILLRDDEQVDVIYDYKKTISAPVNTGDIVGYAHLTIDGDLFTSFPIRAASSVKQIDYSYYLDKVLYVLFHLTD
ncbi:MAG: D-alanyl-D-alanine carboxypeptidase [Lachnospiraceae bacterium]|nr:D-alanyl-D-alanine carboxypeptidase [Lachnospiraceae bacterium]